MYVRAQGLRARRLALHGVRRAAAVRAKLRAEGAAEERGLALHCGSRAPRSAGEARARGPRPGAPGEDPRGGCLRDDEPLEERQLGREVPDRNPLRDLHFSYSPFSQR